jgi:tRNA A-37 threonylcarbamoyl transferase component Bud32/dienelactone hydrolase
MDPLLGALVSHYRILEQIGVGGMGVVYLAEDQKLHRQVALKFIAPDSSGDISAQKRFLREAQVVSTLDHPSIATVYEVGDYQGQLFIAMAYYRGETLRHRIERGAMSLGEVASIAEHIADGLQAAHDAGVVHRDLKPANVFITTTGQVKILDFGLAKVAAAPAETTAEVTATGTTLGTLSYMSPEQARGEHVDGRADVWALGVLLFEMVTGRQPFRGDSATAVLLALATNPAPSLSSLRADVPVEFTRLVERALTKDPKRRTLTAGEIAHAMAHYRGQLASEAEPSRWRMLRRPAVAIPIGIGVLIVAAVASVQGSRYFNWRWAKYTALPEVARLADRGDFIGALELANRAAPLLPADPELNAIWPRISRTVALESQPAGATISYLAYGTDQPWRDIGTTPNKSARLPLGLLRIKAEKAGFDRAEDVFPPVLPIAPFTLQETGKPPEGMVRAAPGRGFSIYIFGLETPRVTFNGFWIDKYEVTNRQYKAFVDAGGYRRQEFWKTPFVSGGKTLPFDQAMNLFRDATGRPGPATWTLGNYPSGQDDMPVTGVSWHEASAYAAFTGRSIPTVYHWFYVAAQGLTGFVIPFGNFNGTAPVAVSATRSVHRFGAYGLAGNVKEWCVNEAPGEKRYVLGGGWDEPPYMFRDADARSPFDRAPNIGFRTVKYDEGDSTVAPLSGLVMPPSRNYANEKPVSDEVFKAYRHLYTYDNTDLAAKVEATDDSNAEWRVEKISLAAAYGPERMITYLLLPKTGHPPYQTVVFMPGSGAWDQRTPPPFANPQYAFLLRSGRAVALPVYKGAWERANSEYHGGDQLKSTNIWRDYVIMFAKDIGRTLDYLSTRPDIDASRFGFFGFSRGASLAPPMLTREPRFKAAALWIPGLYLETMSPEVDPINFAPRVTLPVLQLSGRYDYNFPDETSSLPFFRLLGTPADHKRRVVYDTGHNLPPNESIKETLDWFDKYLGQPQ